MIDAQDPAVFSAALAALRTHRAQRGIKGRFVQLYLGLKFFEAQLPRVGTGRYIETSPLQRLLDDLFAKASRPTNDCVLMLFTGNYLARTGEVALGHAGPQNTWRNNLNLQKGAGCYAAPAQLAQPAFLTADRSVCPHLVPVGGPLSGATCGLVGHSPRYRGESQGKWLQIHGNGYAVTDLSAIANFAPYLAPQGARLPVLPLVVALYNDALPGILAARVRPTLQEFIADFGFTPAEVAAYFDFGLGNAFNAAILNAHAPPARAPIVASMGAPTAAPPPVVAGTPSTPPATNSGWEAEQFVAATLSAMNWTVHDVSRQRLGYDLIAQRAGQIRYVDVKSSVGRCSPTLTAREWHQAVHRGVEYVLAIVEDFDPQGQNAIHWVPDPAACGYTVRASMEYSLARSAWIGAVVAGNQL